MIYADHNATTPCLPLVADAVRAVLLEDYGNPSSRQHLPGRRAAERLQTARAQVARLVGAHADEVVFTSGATEAANLAIFGVMQRLLGTRPRICLPGSEHEAVRAPAARCAQAGAEVVTLPIDGNGRLDLDAARERIDGRCALVAVMLANNETGVLQDVNEVAAICHAVGALLLCDITQALGKISVDVHALDVDLGICSGHKCYAPKGVGALYRRRGLRLEPLIVGGGQEGDLRSGTENVPGVVGFGAAASYHTDNMHVNVKRLQHLTERFESELCRVLPGLLIHAASAPRLPGTSFIAHPGMRPGWLRLITRVACSPGSSCAAASKEPSATLLAMGVEPGIASNSLRLSFGLGTSEDDVLQAAAHLAETGRSLLS